MFFFLFFSFLCLFVCLFFEDAAWPSGLERWCCNPGVPGLRPLQSP